MNEHVRTHESPPRYDFAAPPSGTRSWGGS
jgi:hypothetical protein